MRSTIQSAIDGVRGCSESPSSGEGTLQQAINTRQDILNALPALSVSGLPNGTQLVSGLITAMKASITSDRDYQSWMRDFASSGSPVRIGPQPGPALRRRHSRLSNGDRRQECLRDHLGPHGAALRTAGLFERGILTHRIAYTLPVAK